MKDRKLKVNETARLGLFFPKNSTADFYLLSFITRENRTVLSGNLLVLASFSWLKNSNR